jgi:DHA2 family multidrug resistance protein
VIAVVCLVSLVFYEWRHNEPIVDVRLFKNVNFASANMVMFMVGAISFASTVLMPQFLQTLMGYTAEKSRHSDVRSRNGAIDGVPLVGQLTTRIQARLSDSVWMVCADLFDVLLHAAHRLADELCVANAIATHVTVCAAGFVFIPSSTRLTRESLRRKTMQWPGW